MGSSNGHGPTGDEGKAKHHAGKSTSLGWGEEITRKLSVAAFGESHKVGGGPSIRQRARLTIFSAFILSLLALGVGVFRTSNAEEKARTFVAFDQCGDSVRQIQGMVAGVQSESWRYQARPGVDTERRLQNAFDAVSRKIVQLIQTSQGSHKDASELCMPFKNQVSDLALAVRRARESVDTAFTTRQEGRMDLQALERAREALVTLWGACEKLIKRTQQEALGSHDVLGETLSHTGRDQLVVFLITFLLGMGMVFFGPDWVIASLVRLRGITQRIELGRFKDLRIQGKDEVSLLALSMQKTLVHYEEQGNKKSAKIFEIRNTLRGVLDRNSEPIYILDPTGKVSYTNGPGARLLGKEPHHVEGADLDDVLFSPELMKAVERARHGDIEEAGVDVTIENVEGQVLPLHVALGSVRDRQGDVSRIVLVVQSK